MSMMQPDPATEFREEKEFRAKVYRMLALGLSTGEVENLLRCRIDWSLFSQETLQDMISDQNKIAVMIPPEYFSGIADIRKTLCQISSTSDINAKKISQSIEDLKVHSELEKFRNSITDLLTGFCVVFGSIIIVLFAIILNLIK